MHVKVQQKRIEWKYQVQIEQQNTETNQMKENLNKRNDILFYFFTTNRKQLAFTSTINYHVTIIPVKKISNYT